MIAQEPAKPYFAKVSRSVALRTICDPADTNNDPTGPQDCWITSEKLLKNGKDGRAQLQFGL